MIDGNTHAIDQHLDEREDWDALQEVTAELEQAEARIEALEVMLARSNGNMEYIFRRWKNGADLRVLAKESGCTQERIRLRLNRYEEDKFRQLEAKLEKALYFIKDLTGCEWPYNDDATRVLAELKGEEE